MVIKAAGSLEGNSTTIARIAQKYIYQPMTVHIAYFDGSTQQDEDTAGGGDQLPQRYLTAAELGLADSFSPKRSRQFLAGRALLRWLCVETFQCLATEVTISLPGDGAPKVSVGNRTIAASISHSHAAVMVAVACYPSTEPGTLAVDIERIQQRRYQPEIVATYAEGAMAGVNSVDSFFLRWTQVEAVAKATGQSLIQTLARPFTAHLPYLHAKTWPSFQLSVYAKTPGNEPETDLYWYQIAYFANDFTKIKST